MPPNNQFPMALQQQQFNQPLQTQQPQYGNIGVQGQYPMMPPGYMNPLLRQPTGTQYAGQQQPNPWYYKIPGVQTIANIASGFKEGALGTPGSLQEYTPYQPHQIAALDWLLNQGAQQYQNPYEGFQGIEDYAHKQWNERMVPQLLEQLGGLTNNARLSSSPYSQGLASAGSDIASRLGAFKAQYGMQNRQQGLQALSMGATPQSQFATIPGAEGWLPAAIKAGAQGAGYKLAGVI